MARYQNSREEIIKAIEEYKGPEWAESRANWKKYPNQKYAFEYDGTFYPPSPIFKILEEVETPIIQDCLKNLKEQGFMIVVIHELKDLDYSSEHCPTCKC